MMKHKPIALTLLCTSLVWCSAPNAMESDGRFVLDSKVGEDGQRKVLVLTESGLAKAKALQERYDQQNNQRNISLSNLPKSEPPKSADNDNLLELSKILGLPPEELELSKALLLSFEKQSEEQTTRVSLPLEAKSQPKPSGIPYPVLREEDNHPELKLALLRSEREVKEAEEKRQAEVKRTEARKVLEEAHEIQKAQMQSLLSQINELSTKKECLNAEHLSLILDFKHDEESRKHRESIQQEIDTLESIIRPLEDERSAIFLLNNQIFEEILHLIRGGDPRDLPWKEEASLILQGGTPSLPSNLNSNSSTDADSKK